MKIRNLFKLAFATLVIGNFAFSDPAPFGLEINKATKDDFAKKFGVKVSEKKNSYEIASNKIPLDYVESASFAFYKDIQELSSVYLKFNTKRFNVLYEDLNSKYEKVEAQIPFVGNKYARFTDGNTTIELEERHLGFNTDLLYIDTTIYNKALKEMEDEKANKAKEQRDLLWLKS